MFLSEAPYWSKPPRNGNWASQRSLSINVISDGKYYSHIHSWKPITNSLLPPPSTLKTYENHTLVRSTCLIFYIITAPKTFYRVKIGLKVFYAFIQSIPHNCIFTCVNIKIHFLQISTFNDLRLIFN